MITPGGILAIKYNWPSRSDYCNYNTFLTIEKAPSDPSSYFWAFQFEFTGGNGGYMGIQTSGNLNGKATKIAIFSIWDTNEAKASNIPGAWAGPFGGEGVGMSCRIPFDWKENETYSFELIKKENNTSLANSNWWSASIIAVSSEEKQCIGQILLPDSWGLLTTFDNFFIEYFRQIQDCSDLPYTKATISPPNRNKNTVVPISSPTTEQYGLCATHSNIVISVKDSVIAEIGKY